MKINIAGVAGDSIVDGPGLRQAIFAQGCKKRCEGCHNPAAQPFGGGEEQDTAALAERALKNPLCAGVTLSGGEPFEQAGAMADIARRVRAGGKNVWLYTGYTYEELQEGKDDHPGWAELLAQTDVLVDGPFILAERSLELAFRGSRNQRVWRRHGEGFKQDDT